jgi:hypothetical protein
MAMMLKRVSRLPFAPIVAGLFACAAGVLVMATPGWLLEQIVARAGLASVLSAAQPPLGSTARLALAGVAAIGTGLVSWICLFPVARLMARPRRAKTFEVQPMQFDRSRDTIPDGGFNRPPIFADTELGVPFMSDEALAIAPVGALSLGAEEGDDSDELMLDTSFIADEPITAISDDYIAATSPARDMPTQSFDISTPPPAQVAVGIPVPAPADPAAESIADLIARLERGLNRRANANAAVGIANDAQAGMDTALRQALGTLERLAAGAR